jgi:hypothetical protein
MRTFKFVDLSMQVFLITAGILYCVCIDPSYIFYTYALPGAWQLISIVIHYVYSSRYFEVRDRRYYVRILAVTLLLGLISYLAKDIASLYIPACTLPFLYIWYASICYIENKIMAHKTFVHIK